MITKDMLPMTISKAAENLGVSYSSVLRLCRMGVVWSELPEGKQRGALVVGGNLNARNDLSPRPYRCPNTIDMFPEPELQAAE